jgi:hypothetical protein
MGWYSAPYPRENLPKHGQGSDVRQLRADLGFLPEGADVGRDELTPPQDRVRERLSAPQAPVEIS